MSIIARFFRWHPQILGEIARESVGKLSPFSPRSIQDMTWGLKCDRKCDSTYEVVYECRPREKHSVSKRRLGKQKLTRVTRTVKGTAKIRAEWGTIPDPRSQRTRLKVRLIRKHISCHSLAPSCKRRMRFILVREYVLEFVSARKSMLSPNKPGRVWAKHHLISRFDFYRSIFPDKRPHCLPSE